MLVQLPGPDVPIALGLAQLSARLPVPDRPRIRFRVRLRVCQMVTPCVSGDLVWPNADELVVLLDEDPVAVRLLVRVVVLCDGVNLRSLGYFQRLFH